MNNNNSLGVKITLKQPFAVVKETLERVGICNKEVKKIFPSCYLVEIDEGIYKIFHFKELFIKENKEADYSDKDQYRRNTICFLLKEWGLIEVEDELNEILIEKIDVIPFSEKKNYRICHKYLFKRAV